MEVLRSTALSVLILTNSQVQETESEMPLALAGKIDFDREFVLALYGQCWKMEDGRYGFYSPSYGKGGSNQRWGFCHAADCHLLDPERLADTKNHFKYWEHHGDRDPTVAKFNSFYLGGIAHELGHGLGLPHHGETGMERFRATVGLRNGTQLSARAIFIVLGDGEESLRTKQLKPGEAEAIDLEIRGVKQLPSSPRAACRAPTPAGSWGGFGNAFAQGKHPTFSEAERRAIRSACRRQFTFDPNSAKLGARDVLCRFHDLHPPEAL